MGEMSTEPKPSARRGAIRRFCTLGPAAFIQAGPARIRTILYMAALVGTQHILHIKVLYQRLQERGKTKMSALGAAMRKPVHLCFGVLKTRQPYQPDYTVAENLGNGAIPK